MPRIPVCIMESCQWPRDSVDLGFGNHNATANDDAGACGAEPAEQGPDEHSPSRLSLVQS